MRYKIIEVKEKGHLDPATLRRPLRTIMTVSVIPDYDPMQPDKPEDIDALVWHPDGDRTQLKGFAIGHGKCAEFEGTFIDGKPDEYIVTTTEVFPALVAA